MSFLNLYSVGLNSVSPMQYKGHQITESRRILKDYMKGRGNMMRYTIIIAVAIFIFSLISCDTIREWVSENTDEILNYLQTGDEKRLREHMTSAVVCKASRELQQDSMSHTPVYTINEQGTCSSADVYADDQGDYFSDNSCIDPVAFQPTDYQVFCKEIIALDKSNTVLGNAAIWTANDTAIDNSPTHKWTIPYGTRMKLTIESLKSNKVPYMKRVNYKTITNIRNADGSVRGIGSCKLEMRIYKKDITATNLQPLVSIHGGSWKFRTDGFPAFEASFSHFTDQGFIVFAPFYRLIGNKEANAECNNASWQDMVADVEDALSWVWRNGEAVGAAHNRPVALTGQSAGAHLVSWLMAHPERHQVPISRSLLLYPPTDLKDFASGSMTGGRYEKFTNGIKTVENFFGVDDISKAGTDDLQENAFPDLLHRNPNRPPVFIIHGVADKVVPSMQSVRLCNAYEGGTRVTDYNIGPAMNDGGDPSVGVYRRKYECGSVGKLHLFAESDHAFDLACISNVICQAGSDNTISVLKDSLKEGRQWLMGTH